MGRGTKNQFYLAQNPYIETRQERKDSTNHNISFFQHHARKARLSAPFQ